jgi:Rho GTPase-activating protein SYDE
MKPPPVVVIKRDLRDEEMDEPDGRVPRSRSSRERRTGDGREMTESRSRLGLGLNNYSPQSEQLDLYYNSRPNAVPETPNWGYKAPPPPSVITEQPKGAHAFQPSSAYYQNAGTLESLAEKVHSFYPGQSRRMSAGTGSGVAMSQSHSRFPRSGSDQHLPRVEYTDYSSSLGRHSLLRTNLKAGVPITGGTLGRYGRYEQPPPRTSSKYGPPMPQATGSLARRPRPALDYSSDTEATLGARSSYYYYNNARPTLGSSTLGRGSTAALGGGPDYAKFNSLPRDRPGARMGLRNRIGDRLQDDSDGNMSAPEYSLPGRRDNRGGAGEFKKECERGWKFNFFRFSRHPQPDLDQPIDIHVGRVSSVAATRTEQFGHLRTNASVTRHFESATRPPLLVQRRKYSGCAETCEL